MGGIGPAPFCAMMLADMGATVLRIQRPEAAQATDKDSRFDVLARNRPALAIDLRKSQETELVLELLDDADVLIEGFRPGVMERLGLGPDVCLARRPGLVYGRMTGWGQDGPLENSISLHCQYRAGNRKQNVLGHTAQKKLSYGCAVAQADDKNRNLQRVDHLFNFLDGTLAPNKLLKCCVYPRHRQQSFDALNILNIGHRWIVLVATYTGVHHH